MSVTRNAPCPCGSGKKYKKCCLEKDLESSPTLRGQRFRAARDALLDGILEFLANNFPPDIADMAMDDFERGGVRDEEPGAANVEFFIPYMLFLWTNRHWDRKTRKRVSIDVPLAETYLKAYPRRPTELGRAYLEAIETSDPNSEYIGRATMDIIERELNRVAAPAKQKRVFSIQQVKA